VLLSPVYAEPPFELAPLRRILSPHLPPERQRNPLLPADVGKQSSLFSSWAFMSRDTDHRPLSPSIAAHPQSAPVTPIIATHLSRAKPRDPKKTRGGAHANCQAAYSCHPNSRASYFLSIACAFLCTFLHRQKLQLISFHRLPHSLPKTPGGGGPASLTAHGAPAHCLSHPSCCHPRTTHCRSTQQHNNRNRKDFQK
jgi:hypothetical protein